MAKTFFPKMFIMVPASNPHPPNTEYKVSIGEEAWGGDQHPVLKVQMVYEGEIAGRRSPSYPFGSDDFQRVMTAANKLLAKIDDSEIEFI
ncbi:hypothetical protein B481_2017 [Planococcus halocryophilus Or1]|uniref:hypothetical protein n=1 Tax=Planococcus halocryophilus TaxID=1215089 RepID=UPI0002B882D8|nr:hypothetical protein [Planococcus halocryophilus]EMF46290.1 hypothetical protein B481_2017 [Planococcus halocryophilus Or1]